MYKLNEINQCQQTFTGHTSILDLLAWCLHRDLYLLPISTHRYCCISVGGGANSLMCRRHKASLTFFKHTTDVPLNSSYPEIIGLFCLGKKYEAPGIK